LDYRFSKSIFKMKKPGIIKLRGFWFGVFVYPMMPPFLPATFPPMPKSLPPATVSLLAIFYRC